ncbi:MAG TPA: hypothetical protein VFO91_11635 [Anaerolineales bacterium]|nr:hypothetical protein [Anaerolineales bacterium]
MFRLLPVRSLLLLLLVGCVGPFGPAALPEIFTPTASSMTSTQTPVPFTLTATATPVPTETIQPTSTPEPAGCLKPPDDYTRVEVNGQTLNRRTLAMLAHAQELYAGEIELTRYAVTQGSYTDLVSASFGTHAGGGAVDLSVMRRGTYTVLWDDIPPLLQALRVAGFAAWLRDYGELHTDSPIHIHAIAIGDQELSPAAEEQLTGPAGYFRGYSGLPVDAGGLPTLDRFGGPMLCQWMIDLGYRDMR